MRLSPEQDREKAVDFLAMTSYCLPTSMYSWRHRVVLALPWFVSTKHSWRVTSSPFMMTSLDVFHFLSIVVVTFL